MLLFFSALGGAVPHLILRFVPSGAYRLTMLASLGLMCRLFKDAERPYERDTRVADARASAE